MGIKMTDGQLTKTKQLVEIAEAMSDQLLRIMENHELTRIPGYQISISICPNNRFTTEMVRFGQVDSDAGFVALVKGVYDEEFKATGRWNSAEYEFIFADKELRKRIRKYISKEKPLPPDGLWIGDDRNAPPVDCGVSVNGVVGQEPVS